MTADLKTIIAQRVVESGGRLRVQSALNPALWLCGIISTPALLTLAVAESPPDWLAWLIVSPVVLAMFGFLFLLFYDRDKLQSEDYQLKKKSLELIEHKGMTGPISDEMLAIVAPSDLPKLSTGDSA